MGIDLTFEHDKPLAHYCLGATMCHQYECTDISEQIRCKDDFYLGTLHD